MGATDIGLKSVNVAGSDVFGIGVITAVSRWRGTAPDRSEQL